MPEVVIYLRVWQQVVEFVFENFNVVLFALDVNVIDQEKQERSRKVMLRTPLLELLSFKSGRNKHWNLSEKFWKVSIAEFSFKVESRHAMTLPTTEVLLVFTIIRFVDHRHICLDC